MTRRTTIDDATIRFAPLDFAEGKTWKSQPQSKGPNKLLRALTLVYFTYNNLAYPLVKDQEVWLRLVTGVTCLHFHLALRSPRIMKLLSELRDPL